VRLHRLEVPRLNKDDDPTTGIFLTCDPLDGVNGYPDVANPYSYVHNDPLNKTDPTGLRPSDTSFASTQAASPCPAGEQPRSTPGSPSTHTSSYEVCSPPWENDAFVDFVNWLAGWSKALALATFHANLQRFTTSPVNENLGFVQGMAAIKSGADLRSCAPTGTAVGGGFGAVKAHAMCLWNVPRVAVGAFIRQWETHVGAFAGMYLGEGQGATAVRAATATNGRRTR
jgi:hypothetical protein